MDKTVRFWHGRSTCICRCTPAHIERMHEHESAIKDARDTKCYADVARIFRRTRLKLKRTRLVPMVVWEKIQLSKTRLTRLTHRDALITNQHFNGASCCSNFNVALCVRYASRGLSFSLPLSYDGVTVCTIKPGFITRLSLCVMRYSVPFLRRRQETIIF